MTINVNGNKETIENESLAVYLENKKINRNSVVIELNEAILKKEDVENINLKENDSIEIIRFIGGG
jgi:sulfur carrier protein